MAKDQANYEKLKRARRERDIFAVKLTIRLEYGVMERLRELSDITGRTVSDLFRAGLDLVLVAGRRVSPWKRERKDDGGDDEGSDSPPSPPCPTSDNVRYVQQDGRAALAAELNCRAWRHSDGKSEAAPLPRRNNLGDRCHVDGGTGPFWL